MTQKEEQEANTFAMELLMPEKIFIDEAKKIQKRIIIKRAVMYRVDSRFLNGEEYLVYCLAKKCQVSEDVVRTRMLNLGILTSI